MPFDAADFPPRPERPPRGTRSDTAACVIIVVLATALIVMPISLGVLVDLVRYAHGH